VDIGKSGYAFFDVSLSIFTHADLGERERGWIGADGKFSDLNVFLLLVLQAASSSPSLGSTGRRDRRGRVIELLRGGGKVPISSVCSTYHFVHLDKI